MRRNGMQRKAPAKARADDALKSSLSEPLHKKIVPDDSHPKEKEDRVLDLMRHFGREIQQEGRSERKIEREENDSKNERVNKKTTTTGIHPVFTEVIGRIREHDTPLSGMNRLL